MNNEPQDTPPSPRRPFQDAPKPEPFHRSTEFQRLLWFASLLVFVALFVVYLLQSAPNAQRAAENDAKSAAATAPPTPEEIEARATKLRTLFEGSLADTQNGDEFRETQGYLRFLQLLSSYPPDDVTRRATRRIDYASVVRDPDAWRGEFVTARGFLVYMRAVKLKEPVFGIRDVYRGYVVDPGSDPHSDGEGLVFDLLDRPPTFEMRRDPVEIEGVLYRTASYENERGKTRVVPYVVARNMRVVENPKVGPAGFLKDHGGTLLVLMGLAIFSARLLMYVFQRRARQRAPARLDRHAGFHEMFEAKLRDERRPSGPRPDA
jgi:hypothetical protein